MRIMTSDEVAKYPIENPKYNRTHPFYPPDPDLIGKFFAIWIPTVWYSNDCAYDAQAAVYSILNHCFDGIVINAYERNVPNTRKYCHIGIIPTNRLSIPTTADGTFNLHIKMNPPPKQEHNCDNTEPFHQATKLMPYEQWNDATKNVFALRNILKDLRFYSSDQKTCNKLTKSYNTIRNELNRTCAEYLFDQGSHVTVNDSEWTLITPFKFPPGYVWDTARALTATFGNDSPLIKRFTQLAVPSGTGTHKPDQWWTTCDDPQSVFMIMFSRMLGPERWQYTLACLESTLGHAVDWNATL